MTTVQSVERALAILRCLGGGPAGVSAIAERVRLPKSTVSRLLATLTDLGAVEQLGAGGEYRVGDLMIEIAAGALPGRGLVSVARPHLVELAETVGEDAGLSVLDDGDVYYLDQVGVDAPIQLRDWTGERIAPHCVSSGIVLWTGLSPARLSAALTRPRTRFTPRTVVGARALRNRVAAATARGYEWVYGEYDVDIDSVAAPVRDASGAVVAAVHVHGPAYRFPGDVDPDEISGQVVAAARRISDRLAGRTAKAGAGATR